MGEEKNPSCSHSLEQSPSFVFQLSSYSIFKGILSLGCLWLFNLIEITLFLVAPFVLELCFVLRWLQFRWWKFIRMAVFPSPVLLYPPPVVIWCFSISLNWVILLVVMSNNWTSKEIAGISLEVRYSLFINVGGSI